MVAGLDASRALHSSRSPCSASQPSSCSAPSSASATWTAPPRGGSSSPPGRSAGSWAAPSLCAYGLTARSSARSRRGRCRRCRRSRSCRRCRRWPIAVAYGVFQAGIAFGNNQFDTVLQREIPSHVLSRVDSFTWLVALGLSPVGQALAGPASEAFGTDAVLITAAGLVVVSLRGRDPAPSVRAITRARRRAPGRRRPARGRRRAKAPGRCVSRSRLAPDASKAATASSAERCPAARRRARRARAVASQRNRSTRPRAAPAGRSARSRPSRPSSAAVRDAEAEGVHGVVREAGRDRASARPASNSSPSAYSSSSKTLTNMSGVPKRVPKPASSSRPPGGSQSSGFSSPWPRPDIVPQTQGTRSPQWSRWKWLITIASTCGQPSTVRAQPRQHARPAVQQEAARPLEQVAGLRAARVGPRGRAPDDGQLHRHGFPTATQTFYPRRDLP